MHALRKYLSRYSEPQTEQLAASVTAHFRHVLVVPAYDETTARIEALAHRCVQADALLILVINTPADAPPAALARSKSLLETLRLPNTLCVDRVSTPLDPRAGVGLARKIGSDIGAALIMAGTVTEPWIYQTDADVTLPDNYFATALPSSGTVIFGHHHHAGEPQLKRAVELYDQHMAYYVAGLAHADSPYAYPSLGSTLAIQADSYATVRGYPKRNAGEDFHILNKLAKIGPIHRQQTVTIGIEARLSQRVPFGTGPSLVKIQALLDQQSAEAYLSYHPAVFTALKKTLAELRQLAIDPRQNRLSAVVAVDLETLGIAKISSTLVDPQRSLKQRHKAASDWFDGLRTLRFIHLQQQRYADQPLLETLRSLPWESA